MSRVSVLRLETRFGLGVFNSAQDALTDRWPELLDYVPSKDDALNSFMDSIENANKEWSVSKHLKEAFTFSADPAYKRSQMSNWVFGFSGLPQLRTMFHDEGMYSIMKMHGVRLHSYTVAQDDVFMARDQVMFYKPAARLIAQHDLRTGLEIPQKPETTDIFSSIGKVIAASFKQRCEP